MTTFTQPQIDEIAAVLGYSAYRQLVLAQLSNPVTQYTYDRVVSILSTLQVIDTQLDEMLPDALALEVQGMKLSYPQQLAILNRRGSSLLKELSNLVGVSVVEDKYNLSKTNAPHYW